MDASPPEDCGGEVELIGALAAVAAPKASGPLEENRESGPLLRAANLNGKKLADGRRFSLAEVHGMKSRVVEVVLGTDGNAASQLIPLRKYLYVNR